METKDSFLTVKNVVKSFDATQALRGVDLEVQKGEVHGLIGENGSGKSTLATIIAGVQKWDSGSMTLKGVDYCPKDIFDAEEHGIAMVGQEQNTIDLTTVAENVFIGKEKLFKQGPIISSAKMNKAAQKLIDDLGLENIKPSDAIKQYDFERRKLIEIARALYDEPELLIIDETSTALSKYGRDILYRIIKQFKTENKSVLFISHDINEIMEICDRVTILRDGNIIITISKEDYDSHTMKQYMVGREIDEDYYRTDYEPRLTDDVALSVNGIWTDYLRDISFDLHYGEIIGIGGLTESGMHELGKIMFGVDQPVLGSVKTGNGVAIKSTSMALKNKIAYISKNRDKESLMLSSTILENICLPSMNSLQKGIFITKNRERDFAEKNAGVLSVKMDNLDQNVIYLSGGNKQKVAVAKWLGTGADVFIFDCPTRGIDVGVQSDIYDLLVELRKQKKAIIMITEELPELIGMSDKILIMKDGKITGEISRSAECTENKLINYMI